MSQQVGEGWLSAKNCNETEWPRMTQNRADDVPYTTSSSGRPLRKRFRVRLGSSVEVLDGAHPLGVGVAMLGARPEIEAFRFMDIAAGVYEVIGGSQYPTEDGNATNERDDNLAAQRTREELQRFSRRMPGKKKRLDWTAIWAC